MVFVSSRAPRGARPTDMWLQSRPGMQPLRLDGVNFDTVADPPDNLPSALIDLTNTVGPWPVREQGSSMLCTAYAVAACFELVTAKNDKQSPVPRLSAGFIYWGMRHLIMAQPESARQKGWDTGACTFEDALNALGAIGMCPWADPADPKLVEAPDAWAGGGPSQAAWRAGEDWAKTWTVNLSALPPSDRAIARGHRPDLTLAPDRTDILVNRTHEFIIAELEGGRPVALAFANYVGSDGLNRWDIAGCDDLGTLTFPRAASQCPYDGGHAVCITGVVPDPNAKAGGWFIFRNSLGAGFGRGGYGRVAISDAVNYCWDIFALPGSRGLQQT